MKLKIFVLGMLVSCPLFAHIEPGVYQGKTATGNTCEMTVAETYYLNNERHPLNERIDISYQGQKYVMQHPPVVQSSPAMAYFNHDQFHGVVPTNVGAKAVIIQMVHTENFEGPASFSYIEHQWKTDSKVLVECAGIQKQ
ncbi:MAG: hypothetical protein COT73_06800 [Bdellovibrio sp. CG10_big_fil_rev_8_21_14_0_10_47_8]|nr:MAG: hypothetical protein COT73_06800 [Bdellovibrio sp. CG10_big_fil_rev_8_21_14_0_10_47_8]